MASNQDTTMKFTFERQSDTRSRSGNRRQGLWCKTLQRPSWTKRSKHLGEVTGRKGPWEDKEIANGNPPSEAKTQSSGRIRALITNYSDEERRKDDPLAS